MMRRSRLSLAGLSILFALGLALWEVYFFWFAGSLGTEAPLGLFTGERLGFNMAWLAAIYLTFQLTSIPFALAFDHRPLHRRGGRHGLAGAARGRADRRVRKAALDRHRAALGGGVPAHLHHLGRSVRRIHVQYRTQPPHHGCLTGRVGLRWPRPPICVSVTSRH